MNAISAAMPDVFLSYQQQLMSSTSLYGVTVVEKSRRTGYSWAAGAIAVLTAAATAAAGGMSVYYMGYNLEMAREFIDYCGMWAQEMQLAAEEMQETFFEDPEHPEKQIKAFRVEFASGFEVVALPSVARALRGKQGLVIIDEAAFHDDLEGVLKAAMALRMWGGRVLIISTHNGEENPFNVLINEIRAGKKPTYHLLRCTLDEALEQGLFKRIAAKLGQAWSPEAEAKFRETTISEYGDNADEELFCVPREGGGAAISRALIEKRMVLDGTVLRLTCKPDFVHWSKFARETEIRAWCVANLDPILKALDPKTPCCFGHDFARRSDLSVFALGQILKSLVRRFPLIVEMRNVPFEQQRQVVFYILDYLEERGLLRAGKLDATGNGMYLAEVAMQRYGETRIEMVMMNEPWYRENMPALKAGFEDATIELPRDRDVMDDLALLAFVRGVIRVPERTLGSDGQGRHGDAAVALALAYAASRAEVELYEYESHPQAPAGGPTRWHDTAEEQARADEEDDARGRAPGLFPALRGGMLPRPRGAAL